VMSNDRIPGFNIAGHHTWSISPGWSGATHLVAHSESNRAEPTHVTPTSLDLRPASCPE